MSIQLTHKQRFSPIKKFPIVILADNLMGEANIGSLFRLADAFNISQLVFTGTPINLSSNRLRRTARATVANVDHDFIEDPLEALNKYKNSGYSPIALEITEDSTALSNTSFEKEKKILLVIGNERNGISASLLDEIQKRVHIDMFGNNSSMNVSHATGIALYEITKTLPPLQEK